MAAALAAVAAFAEGARFVSYAIKNKSYQKTYMRDGRIYSLMYDRPRNATYALVLDGREGVIFVIRNNIVEFDRRDVDEMLNNKGRLVHRFTYVINIPLENSNEINLSYLWRRHYSDLDRINMVGVDVLDFYWYAVIVDGVPTFYVKKGIPCVMGTSVLSETCKTVTSVFNPVAAAYTCAKAILPPRVSLENFLNGAKFHTANHLIAAHTCVLSVCDA